MAFWSRRKKGANAQVQERLSKIRNPQQRRALEAALARGVEIPDWWSYAADMDNAAAIYEEMFKA